MHDAMRLCNGAKLNVFQRAIEVELALRLKLHVTFDIRSTDLKTLVRAEKAHVIIIKMSFGNRAQHIRLLDYSITTILSRNKAVLRLDYQNKEVILPSLKL